jgi:hypothetical protein
MSNCGLCKGATTMHGSCHLNQLHDCKNLISLGVPPALPGRQ